MTTTVQLYDLAASPNNMKVRIALRYKQIPFHRIPVDPSDRSEVIRISRQPLTPVLVHEGHVVFDSAAILRYLESNFPDSPPLFSPDYPRMQEIERWEHFARGELSEPVGICFRQMFSPEVDPDELRRASALLHDLTARIESRLRESPWLAGRSMTAADVTAAPPVWYGMLPDSATMGDSVARFFSGSLHLGDARERTREWAGKVMAWDTP